MKLEATKTGGWLPRLLPAIGWLREYSRADLSADVVAGLITAILLVPQAMAYGMLAGLPAEVGLYASVGAPVAYALFSSSRTLAVGPVAVAAVMVAEALAAPEVQQHGSAVSNALVLAFECGVILLVMAGLRLGSLVNFLSHPVLSGFTAGAAVLIILTQIPPLLGIGSSPSTASYEIANFIYDEVRAFKPATLILGLASIVLLAFAAGPLRKWIARVSGSEWTALLVRGAPLVVVFLAMAAVIGLDLDRMHGVSTVGLIAPGLPRPYFAVPPLGTWLALFPSAALIALISYVESVSMAKVVANRRRQRIHENQESAALGAANIIAAFTAGMPVAGSFSRTMVNFTSGARTQLASIVAAVAIGLTLLLFTPWFERLPKAALAAIIVIAVVPLIDVKSVRALWRYQRSDASVLLLTFAGVLILGIEVGLIIGLVVSLLFHIWRTSHPHVAEVGRIRGTEHFRNVQRYAVETWPNLALIRVDESLSFANIGVVEDFIMAYVAKHPRAQHLVLVCSAINHIDSSALEAIERLFMNLREAGVIVHLAEVKGPVLDALERVGLPARLAPGRIFFRTTDAVQTFGS